MVATTRSMEYLKFRFNGFLDDSHGYNGEHSILPTKTSRYYVFHGVPCLLLLVAHALSISLAHWLLAAPTLPDFDLRRIESDIKDGIWGTRCDCDVNVYILFFLTFSIKLLSWRWRIITYFFSAFCWHLYIDVCNCLLFEVISRTNLDCTVHAV